QRGPASVQALHARTRARHFRRSRSCHERRPETIKFPWERRHPCLRASANSRLTEARRQGCLRSQGFSEEITEQTETAGGRPFVAVFSVCSVISSFTVGLFSE